MDLSRGRHESATDGERSRPARVFVTSPEIFERASLITALYELKARAGEAAHKANIKLIAKTETAIRRDTRAQAQPSYPESNIKHPFHALQIFLIFIVLIFF